MIAGALAFVPPAAYFAGSAIANRMYNKQNNAEDALLIRAIAVAATCLPTLLYASTKMFKATVLLKSLVNSGLPQEMIRRTAQPILSETRMIVLCTLAGVGTVASHWMFTLITEQHDS